MTALRSVVEGRPSRYGNTLVATRERALDAPVLPVLPEWMDEAACRDIDNPDMFFGKSFAQAKAVCAGCPVLFECSEYGRTEEYGIWGGTTERDRKSNDRADVLHLYEQGLVERDIAEQLGITYATVRRYTKAA